MDIHIQYFRGDFHHITILSLSLFQTYSLKKSTVTPIDVGAGIRDTILLILSNCPDMIDTFCCIDSDKEFFDNLNHNLADFDNVKFIHTMLSEDKSLEKNLVRTHKGNASSQGDFEVKAVPLDYVTKKVD